MVFGEVQKEKTKKHLLAQRGNIVHMRETRAKVSNHSSEFSTGQSLTHESDLQCKGCTFNYPLSTSSTKEAKVFKVRMLGRQFVMLWLAACIKYQTKI